MPQVVIIADQQRIHMQFSDQVVADEITRTAPAERFVERHDDRSADPHRLQQTQFFGQRTEQHHRFAAHDRTRMRMERNDHAFAAPFGRQRIDPREDRPVTAVHAVVRTDRHHRPTDRVRPFETVKNTHPDDRFQF